MWGEPNNSSGKGGEDPQGGHRERKQAGRAAGHAGRGWMEVLTGAPLSYSVDGVDSGLIS